MSLYWEKQGSGLQEMIREEEGKVCGYFQSVTDQTDPRSPFTKVNSYALGGSQIFFYIPRNYSF
jgi:hypothetical protein